MTFPMQVGCNASRSMETPVLIPDRLTSSCNAVCLIRTKLLCLKMSVSLLLIVVAEDTIQGPRLFHRGSLLLMRC